MSSDPTIKRQAVICRIGLLIPIVEILLFVVGFLTDDAGAFFIASMGLFLSLIGSAGWLCFTLLCIHKAKKQNESVKELGIYAIVYLVYIVGLLGVFAVVNLSPREPRVGAEAYRICSRGYFDCIETSSDGSACIVKETDCLATHQQQGRIPPEAIDRVRLNEYLGKLRTQGLVDSWSISEDAVTLVVKLTTEMLSPQEIDAMIPRLFAKMSLPPGSRALIKSSPRTELNSLFGRFIRDRYDSNICVTLLTRNGEKMVRDCNRNEF